MVLALPWRQVTIVGWRVHSWVVVDILLLVAYRGLFDTKNTSPYSLCDFFEVAALLCAACNWFRFHLIKAKLDSFFLSFIFYFLKTFFSLWNRISHSRLLWSRTNYVTLDGLKLAVILLPRFLRIWIAKVSHSPKHKPVSFIDFFVCSCSFSFPFFLYFSLLLSLLSLLTLFFLLRQNLR